MCFGDFTLRWSDAKLREFLGDNGILFDDPEGLGRDEEEDDEVVQDDD